jgi:hypothetical protein
MQEERSLWRLVTPVDDHGDQWLSQYLVASVRENGFVIVNHNVRAVHCPCYLLARLYRRMEVDNISF